MKSWKPGRSSSSGQIFGTKGSLSRPMSKVSFASSIRIGLTTPFWNPVTAASLSLPIRLQPRCGFGRGGCSALSFKLSGRSKKLLLYLEFSTRARHLFDRTYTIEHSMIDDFNEAKADESFQKIFNEIFPFGKRALSETRKVEGWEYCGSHCDGQIVEMVGSSIVYWLKIIFSTYHSRAILISPTNKNTPNSHWFTCS